ncbi:hypothetical protein [uncultured Dubosiella sp.]|uniref:hypothetical protein n=1 Tax=uncultured Dubosiella sp. TaxID=1937011 RepID=UPI002592CE1A|nr:hypothetical protein [uncultured Dubosiella sp.]
MEKERVLYKAQAKANLEYEQAVDAGFYRLASGFLFWMVNWVGVALCKQYDHIVFGLLLSIGIYLAGGTGWWLYTYRRSIPRKAFRLLALLALGFVIPWIVSGEFV